MTSSAETEQETDGRWTAEIVELSGAMAYGSTRDGWPDFVFAFHDDEEIGPRMSARVAKRTGLRPEDL